MALSLTAAMAGKGIAKGTVKVIATTFHSLVSRNISLNLNGFDFLTGLPVVSKIKK